MSSEHHRVAYSVLVALRATLDVSLTDDAVIFLPRLTTLSREAAAQKLSEYPKPVTCIALEAHGRLAVGVWEGRIPVMFDLEEVAEVFGQGLREDESTMEVIITGARETVSLSWAQYKQFQSDYYLPFATLLGKRERDQEGRNRVVVTVTRDLGGFLQNI